MLRAFTTSSSPKTPKKVVVVVDAAAEADGDFIEVEEDADAGVTAVATEGATEVDAAAGVDAVAATIRTTSKKVRYYRSPQRTVAHGMAFQSKVQASTAGKHDGNATKLLLNTEENKNRKRFIVIN
jgi:hypothetical protein